MLDAMMPHQTMMYGNPHSRTHVFGWEAEGAVEDARKEVASLCGADAKEVRHCFSTAFVAKTLPRG